MRAMIVALVLALGACASSGGGGGGGGSASSALGSEANPIRVNMPAGERAYLDRLRCSDGAAPTYQRLGSAGGARDGHILDIYAVTCANGEPRASQIWMDMYHPNHNEASAPPGFTIVAG